MQTKNLVEYLCFLMFPQNASPRRGSHIGCMFYLSASDIWLLTSWLFLLHCALANVSSNCLLERIQIHIGCISLTFLHYAFSNVSSKHLGQCKHIPTGCIYLTFLQCVFSCVPSNHLPEMMHSHTGCICWTFLQLVFLSVTSKRQQKRMQSHSDCSWLIWLSYFSCPLDP